MTTLLSGSKFLKNLKIPKCEFYLKLKKADYDILLRKYPNELHELLCRATRIHVNEIFIDQKINGNKIHMFIAEWNDIIKDNINEYTIEKLIIEDMDDITIRKRKKLIINSVYINNCKNVAIMENIRTITICNSDNIQIAENNKYVSFQRCTDIYCTCDYIKCLDIDDCRKVKTFNAVIKTLSVFNCKLPKSVKCEMLKLYDMHNQEIHNNSCLIINIEICNNLNIVRCDTVQGVSINNSQGINILDCPEILAVRGFNSGIKIIHLFNAILVELVKSKMEIFGCIGIKKIDAKMSDIKIVDFIKASILNMEQTSINYEKVNRIIRMD